MTTSGPNPSSERLAHIFGTATLGALFPGELPTASLPWPPLGRLKHEAAFDRAAVEAELERIHPLIAFLDPRRLHASQPRIVRAGVAYYMTDEYRRSGRTWADRDRLSNRLPLVELREDGRDVILAGHHRSASALLQGRPVLARCVVHPGRWVDAHRRMLLTPSVVVGDASAPIDAAVPSSPAAAGLAIDGGRAVLVPDLRFGRLVLEALGLDEATADDRVHMATTGKVLSAT